MRPRFVDRDRQHQIASQHQVCNCLSVNLARDNLQDLLNVTDGGAQDRALADGVSRVVVL